MRIQDVFKVVIGTIGSTLSYLFGSWDYAVQTLLILMAIDWSSGIAIAALWGNSPKTNNGGLSSAVGFKGLIRKSMILAMVMVANMLDKYTGIGVIRDGVAIAYITNEIVSIIENLGIMGLPVPKIISRTIDVLKEKLK